MGVRWCGEWSPAFTPNLDPADVPRDTVYLINPDYVKVSLPCELPPGHDGPHSWENEQV